MATFDLAEAQTNLRALFDKAFAGEEVVIKDGDREFLMRPLPPAPKGPRVPGLLKHLIGPTPEDAFAPMSDEEIAEWENAPIFPAADRDR